MARMKALRAKGRPLREISKAIASEFHVEMPATSIKRIPTAPLRRDDESDQKNSRRNRRRPHRRRERAELGMTCHPLSVLAVRSDMQWANFGS
jgi:hypothetical protein